MVLGHVFRQRLNEAPVGGLLVWYGDVRRRDVQCPHVRRQFGSGRVGAQHQHPLQPHVNPGQVQLLQCEKRPIQKSIDDVHGSLLEERGHVWWS